MAVLYFILEEYCHSQLTRAVLISILTAIREYVQL